MKNFFRSHGFENIFDYPNGGRIFKLCNFKMKNNNYYIFSTNMYRMKMEKKKGMDA